MSRSKALTRLVATFLALGLAAEVVLSIASTAAVDLSDRPASGSQSFDDGVLWDLSVALGPGGVRYTSHRERGAPWSPERALGPPDTLRAGDLPTAWASATADGNDEWLELDFPQTVAPSEISVYESFNPGAIVRLCVFDESGDERACDQRPSITQPESDISVSTFAPPRAGMRTRRVKIYIDSRAVRGWNEIDAVRLIDGDGNTHWASATRASSWYGSGNRRPRASLDQAAPRWSTLRAPSRDFASGIATREDRIIEARGWPLPALWGEVLIKEDGSVAGRALPWRPIWINLLVDSAFLGAGLWICWMLATRPVRYLTESARARRGACVRCGYDLQFDLKPGCPECGWRR
jgi:hypothetical protein